MGLKLIYAPQTEPVDADEVKMFLGLDTGDADSDTEVNALIKAGRERCEQITGRSLITRQYRWDMRQWPQAFVFRLPYPPLAWDTVGLAGPPVKSVDSIKYLNVASVLTTLPSTEYQIDDTTEPATIRPAYLKYWPASILSGWNLPNAVQVTFTAGYGTAADVPAEIKQRIKDYVFYCFDRRGFDRDEGYLDRLFEGLSCGSYCQAV